MLLPALNKARGKAKEIQCTNNLKQLGLSFANYVLDYDGMYPSLRLELTYEYWPVAMYEDKYITNPAILFCPGRVSASYVNYTRDGGINGWIDYGYNGYHIGAGWRGYPGDAQAPTRVAKIKKPSETILVTDAREWVYSPMDLGNCIVNDQDNSSWAMVYPVHSKSAVVLWCDGHVNSNKCSSIMHPYTSDPFRNGTIIGDPDNHFDRK